MTTNMETATTEREGGLLHARDFVEMRPELHRGRMSADGWTVSLVRAGGVWEYLLLECHPGREVMVYIEPAFDETATVWLPLVGQQQKLVGYAPPRKENFTGLELISLGELSAADWQAGEMPQEVWIYARDAKGVIDLTFRFDHEPACLREGMGPAVEWALATKPAPAPAMEGGAA